MDGPHFNEDKERCPSAERGGDETWVLCTRGDTLFIPHNNLGKGLLMMSFYWGLGYGTEQKHLP